MNRAEAKKKAQALVAQMDVLEAAAQLSYDAPALDRLNIPEYNWWNEALHGVARAGVATSFPQAIGMAASFDPELVERLGDIAATEGRAKYNEQTFVTDGGLSTGDILPAVTRCFGREGNNIDLCGWNQPADIANIGGTHSLAGAEVVWDQEVVERNGCMLAY